MEIWHLLLGVGGLLTPIAIAALARDRTLFSMISRIKDDTSKSIKASTDPLHERVNRVREEYVREDHLNAHLGRIEKRFDDMAGELRRGSKRVDDGLAEIRTLLRGPAE